MKIGDIMLFVYTDIDSPIAATVWRVHASKYYCF